MGEHPARIERLHRAMAPASPLNEWLKPPSASLPPLVKVDPASIVTPPPGLEVGYVPIVVSQGMQRPAGCVLIEPDLDTDTCGSDCLVRRRGRRHL